MLTAALQLTQEVDVLIAGWQCDAVVEQAKKLPHIHKIICVDAKEYAHPLAETFSPVISI